MCNGKRCKVPLSWGNLEDRLDLETYMLAQMEESARQIKQNLEVTHDRHKSYADQKRTIKEYKVGEHVFLRVKPNKIKLRS